MDRLRRKAQHVATRIEYDVDPTRGLVVVPASEVLQFPCGHPASPRHLTKPGACFECPLRKEA
jgi:hypothetical protein